jgi:hypothetical protein
MLKEAAAIDRSPAPLSSIGFITNANGVNAKAISHRGNN